MTIAKETHAEKDIIVDGITFRDQAKIGPKRFEYHTTQSLNRRFFGMDSSKNSPKLESGDLVWVLKSKGKKKVVQGKTSNECSTQATSKHENELNETKNALSELIFVKDKILFENAWRTELFLRARVVYPSTDERVLIQYPKGSQYKVRKANIAPVLEPKMNATGVILVVPETSEYRRMAVIHTCPEDSFLEIGCAFGDCTDRVRRAFVEGGAVPQIEERESPFKQFQTSFNDPIRVNCLGVDKSEDSITTATHRFPETLFRVIQDALSYPKELEQLCFQHLKYGRPTVVAIDINGSRELPAVLQCIKVVIDLFCDDSAPDTWPRLLIVKSRALYSMVKVEQAT